ncbi:MAG TPA: hypothetical protein VLG50_07545 [Candidatus Saccharimonadales bacterium]|nr:hypothetical protein [Candidatus Saccharimonadales bacterium]
MEIVVEFSELFTKLNNLGIYHHLDDEIIEYLSCVPPSSILYFQKLNKLRFVYDDIQEFVDINCSYEQYQQFKLIFKTSINLF